MQYILTQDVMDYFRSLENIIRVLPSVDGLQKMCTKIADEWPTFKGWDKKSDPSPWGCIITAAKDGAEWYCDKCPVQNICPLVHKEWSK